MNSVWVIRERESGHYWNGFGWTPTLSFAHLFNTLPKQKHLDWLPVQFDVLELRLIERADDESIGESK